MSLTRWLTPVVAVLLVVVQLRLWVAGDGVAAVWRLEQAIEAQRAENDRLAARNRRLAAEVLDLKQGLAAVEARARRDLGMIHRDETFFQLVDP